MEIKPYLQAHLCAHPAMRPRDVVKHCYQASFGAEHLLCDPAAAWAYFKKEYDAVEPKKTALCEDLSDDVSRVHLGAWKAAGLPPQWLFQMFLLSCTVREDGMAQFTAALDEAEHLLKTERTAISPDEWSRFRREYEKSGMPAVHHSDEYRCAESPAYRIVLRRILRVLPILQEAARRRTGRCCVIALDGRAASGKSTMAQHLALILDADTVHMDDFFLPPALRSEERFAVPGSNVHHERFCEEVLPHLRSENGFSYRRFDCSRMDYGTDHTVAGKPFCIVEGSYALHPSFGDYADITVFSDVSSEEQMRRILHRNGEMMAKMFASRWIPMEEAYFREYNIREKAQMRL